MSISHTTAGAELLSCDLDVTCIDLDCTRLIEEFGESLSETQEGLDFLAHYCGLEYIERLPNIPLGEADEYS